MACFRHLWAPRHVNPRIQVDIEKEKMTVILGPSGSGKSTMLNLIGGMDIVTMGKSQF